MPLLLRQDCLRYLGIAKNANRLYATCALVNLLLARKKLLL